MNSASTQPPLSCPLDEPDEWQRWADSLDPASWILYASELINGLNPHALSHAELLLVDALIDRRAEMVRDLLANRTAETVH